MKEKLDLPEEVQAEYQEGKITVEKNSEKVEKRLQHAQVDVNIEEGQIIFQTDSDKKNVQSIVTTFKKHVQNMIDGLENHHEYKLKAVYAHFPMTVKTQNKEIVVENFMGERHPRKAKIDENVDVNVDGEEITVKSPDKEAAAQTAARIEQLSKKGNRDPRTFQDGIYIVEGEQ